MPFVVLAIAGTGALWVLRDTWVDWFATPHLARTENPTAPPNAGTRTSDPGARSAQGNLAGLFSGDDYPADAQMNDEQGTVRVSLAIDERGRVDDCDVVESSGSKSLDSATCRILQNRARFTPASDSRGRPVRDTCTQSISWRLEG